MSEPVDEPTAWKVVLATTPLQAGSRRLGLDEPTGTWLEVDAAGAWTTTATVTDAARDVFDIYLPLRVRSRFVIGQLGQSLDGRIATESGASHYVTGAADIERLHRLRALVDAVVVGAGTVAADDPLLTVREVEGESPVRVVLDSEGRLHQDRRVFTDGAARTLVARAAAPASAGFEVRGDEIFVPGTDGSELDLATLLRGLASQGLHRILVEGGGVTVSSFLREGLLDRLHIAVAPVLIGSGRPSIILDPVDSLEEALRPRCRHFRLGRDVLFDLDLRAGSG